VFLPDDNRVFISGQISQTFFSGCQATAKAGDFPEDFDQPATPETPSATTSAHITFHP